jgi:O-antigen/teichoic acid export membrane protein
MSVTWCAEPGAYLCSMKHVAAGSPPRAKRSVLANMTSSMSRTQKSAWSVASGLLFAVTSVSTTFLATPWLLYWLGAERFGAYRVLLDWMGYLALFELGLSGALMGCLAPKVGQGDAGMVRRLLIAGLQAYGWAMLAMLAGGLGLVLALPHVVALETVRPDELRTAGVIALSPALLTPLLVFRSLAEARQRSYLVGLLMTMQSVLTAGLLLAAARAGWGLPGQSLAGAVAQLPAALILMRDGRRAYGERWSLVADPTAKQALWSLSRPTFIHSLTDRIGLISDNLIIAWLLGPVAVAAFYLTQQLGVLAQFLLRGLGNATWAGLVELHAQGQGAIFRLRFLELTSTVSGLAVAALGPIVAYNHHFVKHWVGAASYAGEGVTVIACVNVWFWSLYSLWGWLLLGTGQIGRWVPYAIVFTLVNVVVSIVGTLTLGLVGPFVGTLTGFLVVNSWALPMVLQDVFELSPWKLWRTALAPLQWGLPCAVLLWLLARIHTPWGWLGVTLEMGLAGLGGLALWWTLSLNRQARTQWQCRLRSVLGAY